MGSLPVGLVFRPSPEKPESPTSNDFFTLTTRRSQFLAPKRFRREQCRPERRSVRSINVCERTDEPWRLPAEVMCRVQREKTWYSAQRGCIL